MYGASTRWQAINDITCSTALSSEFYYYYSISQMRNLRQERLINLTKKTQLLGGRAMIPGSLTPDPRLLLLCCLALNSQVQQFYFQPIHTPFRL